MPQPENNPHPVIDEARLNPLARALYVELETVNPALSLGERLRVLGQVLAAIAAVEHHRGRHQGVIHATTDPLLVLHAVLEASMKHARTAFKPLDPA